MYVNHLRLLIRVVFSLFLVAGNIKSGVTIFNVSGNLSSGLTLKSGTKSISSSTTTTTIPASAILGTATATLIDDYYGNTTYSYEFPTQGNSSLVNGWYNGRLQVISCNGSTYTLYNRMSLQWSVSYSYYG